MFELHHWKQFLAYLHRMVSVLSYIMNISTNVQYLVYLVAVKFGRLPTFLNMCYGHAHTYKKYHRGIRRLELKLHISISNIGGITKNISIPHSFPVYAIQAKAERASATVFKWLKNSDLRPVVNVFAFRITSFSGLRNPANPARSGFCKSQGKHSTKQSNSF